MDIRFAPTFATPLAAVVAAIGFAASAPASAGTAEITWHDPQKYADAGAGDRERQDNLRILTGYLQSLAAKNLPEGQQLRLEVLDLDLAGTVEPSRRTALEHRVVRGMADWPSMTVPYELRDAAGAVLRSGEERLKDLNYTHNLRQAGARNTDLYYEKYMLDHWFRERFGPQKQAANR